MENFNKGKGYSSFIDNIWGDDIADKQLISKFNKEIHFLCVIDIYSKYVWVIPLKDKKCIAITNASQNNLDKSNCKPDIIWVDKGSEFFNRSIKSWLQDTDIEVYAKRNKGKSVVAERFFRTLRKKNSQIYGFNIKKCVYW